MSTLKKTGVIIERGVIWLIRGLTVISSATILFIAALSTIGGLGRITFHPIRGIIETSTLLMAVIVFFAFAYAEVTNQHISVKVFANFLQARGQRILRIVALFFSLTFMVITIWGSGRIAWQSFLVREIYFGEVKFPVWITRQVIPLGCFSMALYLIVEIAKEISQFRRQ